MNSRSKPQLIILGGKRKVEKKTPLCNTITQTRKEYPTKEILGAREQKLRKFKGSKPLV